MDNSMKVEVMDFQRRYGLPADGIPDTATKDKALKVKEICEYIIKYREEEGAVYRFANEAKPILRTGSRGPDVAFLQKELNMMGFDSGAADGIFGPKTYSAVTRLQQASGLVVDGIAGANTWSVILGVHIVELSPTMPKALMISASGEELQKTMQNFVTGNFYNSSTMSIIGWLASDGNILAERHEYKVWEGNPKGTLIVNKDGSVEVGWKWDMDMQKARDGILFCCQGFNLFPPGMSLRQGLDEEGFLYSSVAYSTNRIAYGWNGRKIIIAARPFANAERMQQTMKDLGCDGRAISGDSGGSANLRVNGTNKFITGRRLPCILTW